MRTLLLAIALTTALATPAMARPPAMLDDTVPAPWHAVVMSTATYAANDLRIIEGTTYSANPPGSGYHQLEWATSMELGVGSDTAVGVLLPVDANARYDGSATATGLGDVQLMVSRRLATIPGGGWRTRLKANLPTTPSGQGLGVGSAVSWENFFTVPLMGDLLGYTANAQYSYLLRTTTTDPTTNVLSTSWGGHAASLAQAFEYRLGRTFAVSAGLLASYRSPMEQDRNGVGASGGFSLDAAPGATLALTDSAVLQAAVVVPFYWTGYQDSPRFGVLVGTSFGF